MSRPASRVNTIVRMRSRRPLSVAGLAGGRRKSARRASAVPSAVAHAPAGLRAGVLDRDLVPADAGEVARGLARRAGHQDLGPLGAVLAELAREVDLVAVD